MKLFGLSHLLGKMLALLLILIQYELCAQNISMDTIDIRRAEGPFMGDYKSCDYGYSYEEWLSVHEEMPWLQLRLSLHFLSPNGADVVSRHIREDVTKLFFRTRSVLPLYESCRELVRNSDLHLMPNEYWLNRSASAIIVNDRVLNYTINEEQGVGAGDGRTIYYYSYDLHTGKRITADDLFGKAQSEVVDMLKSRHDDDYERRDDGGREWPKDIRHISNFMILPQEIVFVYQPYEIGFGCDGGFRYTLKYSEFKHLLKAESRCYFNE